VTRTNTVEESLANVKASANTEEQSTYLLTLNVQTAREAGASWREIGRAIGVSHQAAWERFHAKLPIDTATDTADD
jgi:hypothetical protein